MRWVHLIAGISWIGTSFYFNWLNHSFRDPVKPKVGVGGELWSVHGGGFYRVERFVVAPDELPEVLHWFKWEAYLTWLSGASLLVLVYYMGAELYLVDPAVADISTFAAIAVGVSALVLAWFMYDGLCRSPLAKFKPVLVIGLLSLLAASAYVLGEVLGARAAYIHVGSMLGTIMTANVLWVIIPSQQRLVAAIKRGGEPDVAEGRHAAMRSLHNNYMTLPVLFLMISIHYPVTYGHEYNWVILILLSLIGIGTRHFFNLRNAGKKAPWIAPSIIAGLVGLAVLTIPRKAGIDSGQQASFSDIIAIVNQRCLSCHSLTPTNDAFAAPPAGIDFDTVDRIRDFAGRIRAVAVDTETMPPGNITGITLEERRLIGDWINRGSPID